MSRHKHRKRHLPLFALCLVILAATAMTLYSFDYWPAVMASINIIGSKELPIYCVQTDEKKVALSFDAAWGNEDTQNILDILARNDVKVTFFMTGEWVESYPEDVKAIAAAGHDLGNHSENHKEMSTLSAEEMREEITKVHDKVKELTGVEMNLFRPPYGDYNDTVVTTVNECGYYCVQWDVDTLDTNVKNIYNGAEVRYGIERL